MGEKCQMVELTAKLNNVHRIWVKKKTPRGFPPVDGSIFPFTNRLRVFKVPGIFDPHRVVASVADLNLEIGAG